MRFMDDELLCHNISTPCQSLVARPQRACFACSSSPHPKQSPATRLTVGVRVSPLSLPSSTSPQTPNRLLPSSSSPPAFGFTSNSSQQLLPDVLLEPMRRSSTASPTSKFPLSNKATSTIGAAFMDAQSYLSHLQSKNSASSRPRSTSLSSSLVSYDTASLASQQEDARLRSQSVSSEESVEEETTRPSGWKGLNSVMPLPSSVSATRGPTTGEFIFERRTPPVLVMVKWELTGCSLVI